MASDVMRVRLHLRHGEHRRSRAKNLSLRGNVGSGVVEGP